MCIYNNNNKNSKNAVIKPCRENLLLIRISITSELIIQNYPGQSDNRQNLIFNLFFSMYICVYKTLFCFLFNMVMFPYKLPFPFINNDYDCNLKSNDDINRSINLNS